jgi:hypothetical protein
MKDVGMQDDVLSKFAISGLDRISHDDLRAWVAGRLEAVRGGRVGTSELYEDWSAWCGIRAMEPGSHTIFSKTLVDLGAGKIRTGKGIQFTGIRLRPIDAIDAPAAAD